MEGQERKTIRYEGRNVGPAQMFDLGTQFLQEISTRRSVRDFSSKAVDAKLIELAIRAAATAPSGANQQPWTFVAISDPAIKQSIRIAAEAEEQQFYEGGRVTEPWRRALEPIGTDSRKPFLETAPWLVAVFAQNTRTDRDGKDVPNYYVKESVGIACGFFILALHKMGLVTLTHTPSPMAFLGSILGRPPSEKPYILFPVGYPAPNAEVPDLVRKSMDQMIVWVTREPE
jgi:iodotyrosine deiodinase